MRQAARDDTEVRMRYEERYVRQRNVNHTAVSR